MNLPDETIDDLLALGGIALTCEDLTTALQQVCEIAARAVPKSDGASLTTFDASGPGAVAASSEWAKQLDEMQYAEHEGPCLDASRTGALFRVRDIQREHRWPSYMPRAFEAGARSMVSIPLTVESKTLGALNVYSREVDAFAAEDVSIAEIIAGHASLATQVAATLHGHRHLAEQLRKAMASRAVIEQAKGVVMASMRCTPDAAFEQLARQSQHENVKLHQIAEELVRQQRR